MQFDWSFCPDCQRVTQFSIDNNEESCIDCGSNFERNLDILILPETEISSY